ncbi:glycosyltransferase [Ancylothrix sp. C2]|uniref:glycosyltransferase n=1 Tax=Ancylothrix sp. D3o TaxID=2953691 RepID=UPI0021BAA7F3|nr:glycosyltransferase [Ancylothrix sp. D3o]MCT7950021.1 glycosyltransferase [Ancylothrix sp. D3o]
MALKTIALVETIWNGHHPTYFKVLAKTLLELGYNVLAFCPAPEEVNQWINQKCSNLADQFYSFELNDPPLNRLALGKLRKTWAAIQRWRNAGEAIERSYIKIGYYPDLVFFACIDYYLAFCVTHWLVDRIFHYNWSGLYFQPNHLRLKLPFYPLRRGPFNPSATLKSARCHFVAVLDEGIAQQLQKRINNPVVIFPDFCDESPADANYYLLQEIRKKAGNRKIIGLLGYLQRRKGIMTLIEVAKKSLEEDWFFVFAGELDPAGFTPQDFSTLNDFINQTPSNCFFSFNYIPDESKFNSLVNVCDILFAAYEYYPHSSNILTKAALFKKPVIVSKNFCMAERVEKFALGLSIESGDVSACISALNLLLNKIGDFKELNRCEEFTVLHSQKQVTNQFKFLLEEGRR